MAGSNLAGYVYRIPIAELFDLELLSEPLDECPSIGFGIEVVPVGNKTIIVVVVVGTSWRSNIGVE